MSDKKREAMPPTVQDLHVMSRLVSCSGDRAIPLARLASELGMHRSALYRVNERVFRFVGLDPPKSDDESSFPPEVMRLVLGFASVTRDLDSLVSYPRIATGRSLDIVLAEFIAHIEPSKLTTTIVLPARSNEAIEGLITWRFDVAIGHASNFEKSYEIVKTSHPGRLDELDRETLVPWRAIIASPKNASECLSIDWESESFAEWLTREVGLKSTDRSVRVLTFSAALELARRGSKVRFCVPDLFVTNLPIEDQQRLHLESPALPFEDRLVAVFRRRERKRLEWLLNTRLWNLVTCKDSG